MGDEIGPSYPTDIHMPRHPQQKPKPTGEELPLYPILVPAYKFYFDLPLMTVDELIETNRQCGKPGRVTSAEGQPVVQKELKSRYDYFAGNELSGRTLGRLDHLTLKVLEFARTYFCVPAYVLVEQWRVGRYVPGDHFGAHCDNEHPGTESRMLSVVCLLQPATAGGEFQLEEFGPLPLAAGEGLLFSSSVPHQVTQVTEGERFALVTFIRRAPVRPRTYQ